MWSPASVRTIRIVLTFVLLFAFALDHTLLVAADKTAATVVVKDALTSPNQAVTIEAKLIGKGLVASTALGGEPLDLLIDGKVVASAMTGPVAWRSIAALLANAVGLLVAAVVLAAGCYGILFL